MYGAAPSRKALTVALVTPNKPNSRRFRGGHEHGELAPPTRSESFGVDSSSAIYGRIPNHRSDTAWLAMIIYNSTIAAPARVATVVAISFGVSIIIINLSLHGVECNM